ncbi:hypothetical protein PYL56_08160 [Staphylococcus succinus]|uniref:hypothetical protein n=1 Tax=Staphylococcus succinus TaxID=61015 RepID=UPI00248103CE|nr:hypothetical protein [Staphylococcus succinus]MDH9161341.1 hypothetical protein [Staphylococcus succinus]
MKELVYTIGILCLVQGVGGIINYFFSSGNSWFIANYLTESDFLIIIINIILILIGGFVTLVNSIKNNKEH